MLKRWIEDEFEVGEFIDKISESESLNPVYFLITTENTKNDVKHQTQQIEYFYGLYSTAEDRDELFAFDFMVQYFYMICDFFPSSSLSNFSCMCFENN